MFLSSLFVLAAFLTLAHAQSLTCDVGATVTRGSIVFYDTWFRSLACPTTGPPQRCLRGEGSFSVLGIAVDLIGGFCVNDTICLETCTNLANRLISDTQTNGLSVGGIDLSVVSVSTQSCDFECCDTNDCSRQSIDQLRAVAGKATSHNKHFCRYFTIAQTVITFLLCFLLQF